MSLLRRIIANPNFWPVVIVILFGLLAGKGLIGSGYFNMHDDLQMMRQLEMEKCFLTLQIPCRWVPDMGYGFGFPLFNFYPPLPYLFGEVFRLFGVAFTDTVKLTFIFSFIASGLSMYFLAKEFWGKWGGTVSSIFYIWAPYHSVDIYVRGAMDEVWAWIFFPAILASSYKLITQEKHKTRNIILLALGWVGLLLSHNLMAMIFAPVFAGWVLIWLFRTNRLQVKQNLSKVFQILISGFLSLGLVAFFTLPVIFEQKLVDTQTLIQGYYDYSAHFATIRQLLVSRFWGYGPSVWGPNDGLTFQVGWINWILALMVFGAVIVLIFRQIKKNRKNFKLEDWMIVPIYFFVVGWFAVFMIHNKSTFIWIRIPTLRFVQFPWRFLTIAVFAFTFMAGAVVKLVPKKINYWVGGVLIVAVLIYSWNYFLPEFGHLGPLTDMQKFNGAAWELQQTAGIYDYLPLTAKTAPKAPMKYLAEILNGKGNVTNIKEGTNKDSFDISVPKDSEIRLGIFEFPNWKTYVDGKEVPNFVPTGEEWGRMHLIIPAGNHRVDVKLFDTPIRTIGNILSIISWVGLAAYLMLQFKRDEGRN